MTRSIYYVEKNRIKSSIIEHEKKELSDDEIANSYVRFNAEDPMAKYIPLGGKVNVMLIDIHGTPVFTLYSHNTIKYRLDGLKSIYQELGIGMSNKRTIEVGYISVNNMITIRRI